MDGHLQIVDRVAHKDRRRGRGALGRWRAGGRGGSVRDRGGWTRTARRGIYGEVYLSYASAKLTATEVRDGLL